MGNIYSGMTSAQKDNERKYLNNLVSGGGGNAEWAKGQLKQLDAASGGSSNNTSNKSTSSSSKKSSSSGGSSSVYETWEENGRTYQNGVDIGPAGSGSSQAPSGYYASENNGQLAYYPVDYNTSNKTGNSAMYEDNPYASYLEDLQNRYDEQQRAIEEKNRLAIQQGTNRLNSQKTNINQAADDNARQAYIQFMQSQKALPQQLASQGATGGATETANLGIQTAYQNNVNAINQNKANRLQEIDNAIVDLKNTGDLATVEQVLANNQAALDAYANTLDKAVGYNQWAQQFNANRQDTAIDQAYREQAYKDQMAQQQLENDWYKNTYDDTKKKEETNRVITLLENGLVDTNYASTLLGIPVNQLNDYVNYIKKARNADLNNTYSLINNRNSGGGSSGGTTSNPAANNYYNLATQINSQYLNNPTGKGAGEAVIVDDGNGGYTINPNINRESYVDLIIARALDSNMSDSEVKTFLQNLGISEGEISRVAAYYLK